MADSAFRSHYLTTGAVYCQYVYYNQPNNMAFRRRANRFTRKRRTVRRTGFRVRRGRPRRRAHTMSRKRTSRFAGNRRRIRGKGTHPTYFRPTGANSAIIKFQHVASVVIDQDNKDATYFEAILMNERGLLPEDGHSMFQWNFWNAFEHKNLLKVDFYFRRLRAQMTRSYTTDNQGDADQFDFEHLPKPVLLFRNLKGDSVNRPSTSLRISNEYLQWQPANEKSWKKVLSYRPNCRKLTTNSSTTMQTNYGDSSVEANVLGKYCQDFDGLKTQSQTMSLVELPMVSNIFQGGIRPPMSTQIINGTPTNPGLVNLRVTGQFEIVTVTTWKLYNRLMNTIVMPG